MGLLKICVYLHIHIVMYIYIYAVLHFIDCHGQFNVAFFQSQGEQDRDGNNL